MLEVKSFSCSANTENTFLQSRFNQKEKYWTCQLSTEEWRIKREKLHFWDWQENCVEHFELVGGINFREKHINSEKKNIVEIKKFEGKQFSRYLTAKQGGGNINSRSYNYVRKLEKSEENEAKTFYIDFSTVIQR